MMPIARMKRSISSNNECSTNNKNPNNKATDSAWLYLYIFFILSTVITRTRITTDKYIIPPLPNADKKQLCAQEKPAEPSKNELKVP